MKIQPVKFPLNIGTADELRVIVKDGVAYYNLSDTSQTTIMPDGKEFAFKILYSDRLKLEEGQEDIEAINSLIINTLGITLVN